MALAKAGSLTSSWETILAVYHWDRLNQLIEQDNGLVWLFHFHIRLLRNVPRHIGF